MTRKKYSPPTSPKAQRQHDFRKKRKEVNVRDCSDCKAKKGETCYQLTDTRFVELSQTHSTLRKSQAGEKPPGGRWDRRKKRWVPDTVSPDYRPMVLDETYDEQDPEH